MKLQQTSYYKFKFSIVMAIYNAEAYLEEAIQSVLEQDIGFQENVQMILVNDGSTDASAAICDNYKREYPSNIIVVHKENGGVSSARNIGLQYILGKYVNFLDSDDKLSKDTLRKVYSFFEDNYDQVDLVSIPISFFDGREGEHPLNYKYAKGTRIIDLRADYECCQLSVSSAFVKYECVHCVKFDERLKYAEDAKVCQIILLNKEKLGVVADCCYWYRKRSVGELSAIQNSEITKEWYVISLKYFSYEILAYAEKIKSQIPHFIQFVVMQDLQFHFRVKLENAKRALNDAEFREFLSLLYGALDKIDDNIILAQKRLNTEHKCFLLCKKYKTNPCLRNVNNNIGIYVNDIKIKDLKDYHARFEFLSEDNGEYCLEGYYAFPRLPSEELVKVNILVRVNDRVYECIVSEEKPNKQIKTDILGTEILSFKHFSANFSLEQGLSYALCILLEIEGKLTELERISVEPFFPITQTKKKLYGCAIIGNHVITISSKGMKGNLLLEPFVETSETDSFTFAVKLLQDEKEKLIRERESLQSKNKELTEELTKIKNKNKELTGQLTKIKNSTGYKFLKKYYSIRDMIFRS